MKKFFLFFILSLITISATSQQRTNNIFQNKNSIQLDLGGHGLFYSINYERILVNRERFKTAVQAGISYYPPATGIRDVWIPISINEFYSLGNHHIEVGLGIVPIYEAVRYTDNSADYWFWSRLYSGRIGYRYQKPDGRFLIRAGFTPMLEREWIYIGSGANGDRTFVSKFHPFGGVTVGYTF
ncbi:MAG: hypothetical protein K9J30_11960 [Bacteroidales bacterium]|nr:hypothetical protein [Bacteroidales bacterium]